MKFQVQSDIHLEVGNQYDTYKITPTAPYLILAGDIGNLNQYNEYLSFLRVQCAQFRKVFWVLGNHEFYNITREAGVELAKKLTHESGCEGVLVLLHRARYDLTITIDSASRDGSDGIISGDGDRDQTERKDALVHCPEHNKSQHIVILGCTLNSNITGEEDQKLLVRMKVSDFHKIQDWTVDDHNAEHERDITWLRQEVQNLVLTSPEQTTDSIIPFDRKSCKEKSPGPARQGKPKILVITHHAPFRKGCSKPQHEESDWHDAFATELLSTEHTSKTAAAALVASADAREDNSSSTSQAATTHFDKLVSSEGQGNILQNVHTWVFGHTHYTTECIRGGVRCIANQRGYVFPWQMKGDADQREAMAARGESIKIENASSKDKSILSDNETTTKHNNSGNWVDGCSANQGPNSANGRMTKGRQQQQQQQQQHRGRLPFHKKIFNSIFSGQKPVKPSFVVRPPKELQGHQGDGSKPFDPLRYIEF